jgi:hypothetical protein
MSEYEIGRDIQDLRSRLARLEANSGIKPDCGCVEDRGASMVHQASTAVADAAPLEWKLEKGARFPPFLLGLLGVPLHSERPFDAPPQSKTWGMATEPWIHTVNWSGGGSDEFFRLVNQSFSVLKWTTPGTGAVNSVATYSGTRIASGRAKTASGSTANFSMNVKTSGGTPLLLYTIPFYVACNENDLFIASSRMDPGQFDLVAGASFSTSYSGIQRC